MKNSKQTTKSTRLSLEDFKIKKNVNQNDFEKVMGNPAASCHFSKPWDGQNGGCND